MSKQIKKCAYYDYMLCKTFLHTLLFEDASSLLFLTYCRIDIFRVLRQSFCGKFQIACGFWNPANPAFRMYGGGIMFAKKKRWDTTALLEERGPSENLDKGSVI